MCIANTLYPSIVMSLERYFHALSATMNMLELYANTTNAKEIISQMCIVQHQFSLYKSHSF